MFAGLPGEGHPHEQGVRYQGLREASHHQGEKDRVREAREGGAQHASLRPPLVRPSLLHLPGLR